MSQTKQIYDVLVVGAGHAGIEASLAAARMGYQTLVLTLNLDHIGQMSCNPAIGGIGKGHLVKEIDALGGEMARAIDETGIQFRMLNTKKGPAVRASRAQADKALYRQRMKRVLESCPNLTLKQASVERLLVDNNAVTGVESQIGEIFAAHRTILTTGTFLKGLIHVGDRNYAAGRAGDFAAQGLSESLQALGLRIGRLKTGTCPRLNGKTIDYSRLVVQNGDPEPLPFSFSTERITRSQVPCYITYTNPETHEVIRSAIHRSPMYSGIIQSSGPRYCPSIEDKVIRFADKQRHQIFLEPEGYDTVEVYPNGISTSLPLDVQTEMVHTIEGLENAEIMRPGYAIEYDYVEPTQLHPSLETKKIPHLYLAGQINGTTGYEEAASQGLMAAINAVQSLRGAKPVVLSRHQAYIGVLIDDLVTKGTDGEPYRMFTSRAEYRLLLREDNADLRLTGLGFELGLADRAAHDRIQTKRQQLDQLLQTLQNFELHPTQDVQTSLSHRRSAPLRNITTLDQLLRRPELTLAHLAEFCPDLAQIKPDVALQAEVIVKYTGYVERQAEGVKRFQKLEAIHLPDEIDYARINGLSQEVKEKLTRIRPRSLAQAYRIPGVTPAAMSVLSVYLRKREAV